MVVHVVLFVQIMGQIPPIWQLWSLAILWTSVADDFGFFFSKDFLKKLKSLKVLITVDVYCIFYNLDHYLYHIVLGDVS